MLTQYAFSILFIDKKKAKFSNDRFGLNFSFFFSSKIVQVECRTSSLLERYAERRLSCVKIKEKVYVMYG